MGEAKKTMKRRTAACRIYHAVCTVILFPNVFEFAFLWFVALAPWGSLQVEFRAAIIFHTALKMIQEFFLHIVWPAKLLRMKRNFRGYHPALRLPGWKRLGV